MRRIPIAAALIAGTLAMLTSPALAETAAPARYSVETTLIGTLLDDPAAKAVLVKDIPEVIANPQLDQARGMTFKQIQQYAPDQLSDEVLARIQADLDKLAPKG